MAETERSKKHIEIAERLQDKLLEYYERKLDEGTLTDTGAANLQRLLADNGWSLDPSKLSDDLKSKLTQNVSATELDADDEEYIAGAIGR